ncbi:IS1096 element passenger TnpR family protein [Streptomyces decoyicus]|uniref:IS1096 element passenger TnpR family protein n=1 Tax=Streptomyces decoyicus TaxID=249567 RepID=UPI0033A3A458
MAATGGARAHHVGLAAPCGPDSVRLNGRALHAFEDRSGGRYAPPEDLDTSVSDEEETVLADVLPGTGDRMDYPYDFGDDWLLRITMEGVIRPTGEGEGDRAVCMGRRRSLPPAEDPGGVWGLTELLERCTDGERPIPTVVLPDGKEWVGYEDPHDLVLAGPHEAGFDPAAFEPPRSSGARAGAVAKEKEEAEGLPPHEGGGWMGKHLPRHLGGNSVIPPGALGVLRVESDSSRASGWTRDPSKPTASALDNLGGLFAGPGGGAVVDKGVACRIRFRLGGWAKS